MARFIAAKMVADQAYGFERVHALLKSGRLDWVQSPAAGQPPGTPNGANATTHAGFDNDRHTLEATTPRILRQRSSHPAYSHPPPPARPHKPRFTKDGCSNVK